MPRDSRADMRFLKGYAVGATSLVVVLSVLAFRRTEVPHFKEIEVERINVVEPDGTLRMTISNHEMMPQPVIGGKSYPLRTGTGGAGAGMIFFNDEGNEDGGLTFAGHKTAEGYTAGEGLSFDQYNQDETVTLSYNDQNRRRTAGLLITDRPNESIQAFAESAMVFRKLPEGADRTRRLQAFRERMRAQGYGPAPRLFAGKGVNKESMVTLSDPKGRPRIRMMVDSLGTPSLQFLDADGRVTYEVPAQRR